MIMIASKRSRQSYFLLSVGIGFAKFPIIAFAEVECNQTSTCEAFLRPGSTCIDGKCSNPFVKGCLNRILGDKEYPKIRTCNSDDGPDATTCVPSPLDYEEVRMANNDWESSMFHGWILQILLSEVLDVPATIENGPGGGPLSFYDERNSFAYPTKVNNFDALYKANEVGDCRDTNESCAHFLTEVWMGEREFDENALVIEGNGMLTTGGWFIPRFVAQNDSSLIHYYGLSGDENRQKLADTFKRPLRWIDYCAQVSPSNCTVADKVASRAPAGAEEGGKYFKEGDYTGMFVATDKNDCTNNTKCTGHVIDYPCRWAAYTNAIIYWHNMSLDSDSFDDNDVLTTKYSYSDILDIFAASNATRSPIIFRWWWPEPNLDLYDMAEVKLPDVSRECLYNRPRPKPDLTRCDAPREALVGKKVGSCGYPTHTTDRYWAASFRQRSLDTPAALRSPAYDFVSSSGVSEYDLKIMMLNWASRGVDKWNYDPREAVCTWVAENLDDGMRLRQYTPPGYPRRVEYITNSGLMNFALAFGVLGVLSSIASGWATSRFKERKQIKFAQETFLYLFSFGLFLVCTSAIIYSREPSAVTCAARWWFRAIGFTFVLVPLLIKVAAINKLMNDARKMRRTNVCKDDLYRTVAGVVLVVVVYLSVWTLVDPPVKKEFVVLQDRETVEIYSQCASKYMFWEFLAYASEAALIIIAAAVAFQSRKVVQAYNESQVVANMAYKYFLFLVLRVIVYSLPSMVLQPNLENCITSLLLTLESLIAQILYFGTKFVSIYQDKDESAEGGPTAFFSRQILFESRGEETCWLREQPLSLEAKQNVRRNSMAEPDFFAAIVQTNNARTLGQETCSVVTERNLQPAESDGKGILQQQSELTGQVLSQG